MLGDILRLYLAPIKAYLLLALVLGAVGYVGYLKWQISSYELQVSSLQAQVSTCEEEKRYHQTQSEFYQDNVKPLMKHYESIRPLDMREGEIKPEELQISPRKQ